jgi:myo-inositol 2-dehydrogenase / D-chiro-inositol 1-dehydrogenase
MNPSKSSAANRREFLRTSTVVAAGSAVLGGLSFAQNAHAAGGDTLKVGLVGCGDRGTGAAVNALRADQNVEITAMGDMFPDRIESSLKSLKRDMESQPGKIKITPESCFTGFDSYKQVIDSGVDVVLLCSPPHFRPAHLKYAVEKGKHIFCEKPVAVDAPGIRSVIATAEAAKEKKLCLVNGLCYRYDLAKRETMDRMHNGQIGKILSIHVTYNTLPLQHDARRSEWDDMTFQLRNWQYFTWLGGDHIVEQHIHSIDKAAWALHDQPPESVVALGGRQLLRGEDYGNMFDHFASVFEYADGTRVFSNCCQIAGVDTDVTDTFMGTQGICETQMFKHEIKGPYPWKHRGKYRTMYQVEHDEMFAAIRAGKPINNGTYMVRSNLMAIMARMSAYTGKKITWEQAMNSQEDMTPAKYEFGPLAVAPVAMPGITKFV